MPRGVSVTGIRIAEQGVIGLLYGVTSVEGAAV